MNIPYLSPNNFWLIVGVLIGAGFTVLGVYVEHILQIRRDRLKVKAEAEATEENERKRIRLALTSRTHQIYTDRSSNFDDANLPTGYLIVPPLEEPSLSDTSDATTSTRGEKMSDEYTLEQIYNAMHRLAENNLYDEVRMLKTLATRSGYELDAEQMPQFCHVCGEMAFENVNGFWLCYSHVDVHMVD